MFARMKPRRPATRLLIEALEDRTLLSPGDLDATFGVGGLVVADLGAVEAGFDVAIQDDGKLLVAGWRGPVGVANPLANSAFALARLNADGSLDDGTATDSTAGDSFGTGGVVVTHFGSGGDIAFAVSLYPSSSVNAGKILVAGRATSGGTVQFGLARYNSDGNPDDGDSTDGTPDITPGDGFGVGGVVTTDFGYGNSSASSLALQPDGKIVLAGSAYLNSNRDIGFALARYEPDGSLDSSFGTGGLVTTSFGGRIAHVRKLAIQPDGRIVAAGHSDNPSDNLTYLLALARYDTSGNLDATFGTGGRVTTEFIGTTSAVAMAMYPASDPSHAGKIVAATQSYVAGSSNQDFALARYNVNGSIDDGGASDSTPTDSFGTAGKVTTDFAAGHDRLNGVALQPNGKIVAVGYTIIAPEPSHWDFALARYNADGSLDSSFGSGGKVTTNFRPGSAADAPSRDQAWGVAIQPDGNIVAIGASDSDFALARYVGDGAPPPAELVADLEITVEDLTDPVAAGESLLYRTIVTNHGPNDATGVTITQALPFGMHPLFGEGSCLASTPVQCDIGNLPVGGSATVLIQIDPTMDGTILTSAFVQGNESDSELSNNTAAAQTQVTPVADLAVSIMDSPDPVVAGHGLGYTSTIVVTNHGPSTATDVLLADELGLGVRFLSATPASACNSLGQFVHCQVGVLRPGDTATVNVTGIVDVSSTGSVANGASVTAAEADLNLSNNVDTESTTVIPAWGADLAVSVTGRGDPGAVDAVFVIEVVNYGPLAAPDVVLDSLIGTGTGYLDPLPLVAVTATGPVQCAVFPSPVLHPPPFDPSLTCQLGTIASGDRTRIEIVIDLELAETNYVALRPSITSGVTDSNPTNNSSPVYNLFLISDRAVTLTDTVDPATGDLTYSIELTNTGPYPAYSSTLESVTVPGLGPHTLSVVSTTATAPDGVICTAPDDQDGLTCEFGRIDPQQSASVMYTIRPEVGSIFVIQNTTTVSDLNDVWGNNIAQVNTIVAADLAVSIMETRDTDTGVLTYSILVTNNGPFDAFGVRLDSTIGGEIETATTSAEPSSPGTCTEYSFPSSIQFTRCEFARLDAGESVTVTIAVRPAAGGVFPTLQHNVEMFSFGTGDPDFSNNSTSAFTIVGPDLALTVAASDAPVMPGQPLSYTMTISNQGLLDATNVELLDLLSGVYYQSGFGISALSEGVVLLAATPSQGTCQGEEYNSRVTCQLGTIQHGESVTVVVAVQIAESSSQAPTAPRSLVNTASVDSSELDMSFDTNMVTTTTTIQPRSGADLSVSTTASSISVLVNEELTYTVTVRNGGPDAATGLIVTDTLPAGVSFESAGPGGACNHTTGVVTCAFGSLAVGETTLATIVVRPLAAAPPTTPIVNHAGVTGTQSDPDDSNNTTDTATTVTTAGNADLAITVSTVPESPHLGDEVTFVLQIVNNGPDDASSVVVRDRLPRHVANVRSPECQVLGDEVECNIGPLARGSSTQVEIVATVTATGMFLNSAAVSGDLSDPVAGNNTATIETTIASPGADVEMHMFALRPFQPQVGIPVTYLVEMANLGPDAAAGVTLTNPLPAFTQFVSATVLSPGQGSCSLTGSTITCDLDTLPRANSRLDTVALEIQLAWTGNGYATNTVQVSSSGLDPASANNLASETIEVYSYLGADLAIHNLTATPDPIVVGSELTATFEVTNQGPEDILQANVSAGSSPSSLSPYPHYRYLEFTSNLGSCNLFCDFGPFPNGATATVSLRLAIDPPPGVLSAPANLPAVDSDGDGVTDDVESAFLTPIGTLDQQIDPSGGFSHSDPNPTNNDGFRITRIVYKRGDANDDGVLDYLQPNVVSLPNALDGEYVTFIAGPGASLASVEAVANPSPGPLPPDVAFFRFPFGFFRFTATGIPAGGATFVDVVPSGGTAFGSYFKFGRTPDNTTPHWYEFTLDSATATGAWVHSPFAPDGVRLFFVDGQRGDDDLMANGIIVDPGGPALVNSGSIRGQKIHDLDGDGQHDEFEPGLEGWTIQLLDEQGDLVASTQTQPAEIAVVTVPREIVECTGRGRRRLCVTRTIFENVEQIVTEPGLYRFTDLPPGTYTLLELPQPGWGQSFPASAGTHSVTLGSGQVVESLDFGNENLGGNVTAQVLRGRLVVRGDDEANRLRIESFGAKTFIVSGADGTLVNGRIGSAEFSGVRRGVRIDTGLGDDAVSIGPFGGSLRPSTIRQRLTVYTGLGDDTVGLNQLTVRGQTYIATGPGRDRIEIIDALLADGLTLDGGPDSDSIRFARTRVDEDTELVNTQDDLVEVIDLLLRTARTNRRPDRR